MKPGEWFDALRKIDISDLDTNNIGAWPAPSSGWPGSCWWSWCWGWAITLP